jgi:PAS domain S-box-containing protein
MAEDPAAGRTNDSDFQIFGASDRLRELESLVAACPVAIVATDKAGRIRFFNPAFEQLFLCSVEQDRGKPLEHVLRMTLEELTAPTSKQLTGVHRRDGSVVDLEFQSVPQYRHGEFNGTVRIFHDITARHRVEVALRLSEEKFHRAFHLVPTTMSLSTAEEGRLIDVNDNWVRLTGYSREEAIGHTPVELGLFADPEEARRLNAQIAAERQTLRNAEVRIRARDGGIVIALISADEFEVDGVALRIVVSSDITELRRAQEDLSKQTRELLRAQENERRRIAMDLHDNVGQRFALLQFELERIRRAIPDPASEALERLMNVSNQVADTAAELQGLSHELYSPGLELSNLDDALGGLCATLRQRLNVDIQFVSHGAQKEVPSEVALCLFRVLQEALTNAAKHSGTDHIDVTLIREDQALQLRVKDFGSGFDPAAATTPGIGLLTMRERVTMVHGTLDLSSAPRAGTEINVRIPLPIGTISASGTDR